MSDILIKFPDRNQIKNRDEFIHTLGNKLKGRVKEAWLFGSVARGDFSERSDVDMIIVLETGLPFHERITLFPDLPLPGYEMDILIYTPQEFEDQKKRAPENGFWKSIINTMVRVI